MPSHACGGQRTTCKSCFLLCGFQKTHVEHQTKQAGGFTCWIIISLALKHFPITYTWDRVWLSGNYVTRLASNSQKFPCLWLSSCWLNGVCRTSGGSSYFFLYGWVGRAHMYSGDKRSTSGVEPRRHPPCFFETLCLTDSEFTKYSEGPPPVSTSPALRVHQGPLVENKLLYNDKILIPIVNTHHLKTIKEMQDNLMNNMSLNSQKLGWKSNLNLIFFVLHFQKKKYSFT